jgi:hypothetical protein
VAERGLARTVALGRAASVRRPKHLPQAPRFCSSAHGTPFAFNEHGLGSRRPGALNPALSAFGRSCHAPLGTGGHPIFFRGLLLITPANARSLPSKFDYSWLPLDLLTFFFAVPLAPLLFSELPNQLLLNPPLVVVDFEVLLFVPGLLFELLPNQSLLVVFIPLLFELPPNQLLFCPLWEAVLAVLLVLPTRARFFILALAFIGSVCGAPVPNSVLAADCARGALVLASPGVMTTARIESVVSALIF